MGEADQADQADEAGEARRYEESRRRSAWFEAERKRRDFEALEVGRAAPPIAVVFARVQACATVNGECQNQGAVRVVAQRIPHRNGLSDGTFYADTLQPSLVFVVPITRGDREGLRRFSLGQRVAIAMTEVPEEGPWPVCAPEAACADRWVEGVVAESEAERDRERRPWPADGRPARDAALTGYLADLLVAQGEMVAAVRRNETAGDRGRAMAVAFLGHVMLVASWSADRSNWPTEFERDVAAHAGPRPASLPPMGIDEFVGDACARVGTVGAAVRAYATGAMSRDEARALIWSACVYLAGSVLRAVRSGS